MIIEVVGWPGAKTEQAVINAQAALADLDPDGHVEWISDVHKILELGTVQKPAVIVNGKLKIAGRIPSVHEISTWIEEEMVEDLAA